SYIIVILKYGISAIEITNGLFMKKLLTKSLKRNIITEIHSEGRDDAVFLPSLSAYYYDKRQW
ncbi:MAG TPA: hypothetical protein DCE48_17265, partial [Lachnospiraceae bacterium]|nr:hypothetical protein [Lachnospiraceae bacterium]